MGFKNKNIWISFQDENDLRIEGFFLLVEESKNYIKIKSNKNILTIPYHKINKIKQDLKGGDKI